MTGQEFEDRGKCQRRDDVVLSLTGSLLPTTMSSSSSGTSSSSAASTAETELANAEVALEPIEQPLDTGKAVRPPPIELDPSDRDLCRADLYQSELRELYSQRRCPSDDPARLIGIRGRW